MAKPVASVQSFGFSGTSPKGERFVYMSSGLDITLAPVVGNIVADWSYLETTLNNYTRLLLAFNDCAPPHWLTQEASKRIRLMSDQAKTAFKNHKQTLTFVAKIEKGIWAAKLVRERICHWRMTCNCTAAGNYLTFEDPRGRSTDRARYDRARLSHAQNQIGTAAGRLIQLMTEPEGLALPSDDISLLRRVADMDSPPVAKLQGPSRPPQSSEA